MGTKLELKKIPDISGVKCQIYSVCEDGDDESMFEHFVADYIKSHRDEVHDIYNRLKAIGHKVGAREQYFKLNEGRCGDLVCALYDNPNKKLRLYCVRYGSIAVIVGGGGEKTVRAWQDNAKLSEEATKMIKISELIAKAVKDKDIEFSGNGFAEDNIIIENYE